MESILISQGIFSKEAKAMVATWGDSWFEEGTRLFYFLPTSVVDSILPLEIRPAPPHVARVFVGRMEIFTPTTKRVIRDAIARGDSSVFAKYGRFLNPVTWHYRCYGRRAINGRTGGRSPSNAYRYS